MTDIQAAILLLVSAGYTVGGGTSVGPLAQATQPKPQPKPTPKPEPAQAASAADADAPYGRKRNGEPEKAPGRPKGSKNLPKPAASPEPARDTTPAPEPTPVQPAAPVQAFQIPGLVIHTPAPTAPQTVAQPAPVALTAEQLLAAMNA